MMYQFYIMNMTKQSVVTEEDVRDFRDRVGEVLHVSLLDEKVKQFYMNSGR